MLTNLEKMGLCLKRLMEISADGMIALDENSNIIDISEAYSKKLNKNRKDIIGRHILDVVVDSHLPDYIKSGKNAYEKDAVHRLVADAKTYDDDYCFVTRGTVFDQNGVVTGAVSQVQFIEKTVKLSSNMAALNDELQFYKKKLEQLTEEIYSFDGIIGISKVMDRVKSEAIKASQVDFNVLLTGKTGTGKEVFANVIHYGSKRRSKPFIKINCSAIPTELFESELFGYSDGSFTGAKKGGKKGKFLQANGGTIFLDEIAEMPLTMQVKLLRIIQAQQVDIIGSDKPIPVNVRVIAATNKNLEAMIKENKFREDLYYRLNVINIDIPSLKSRKDDILPLMSYFLGELNEKYERNVRFSTEVEEAFLHYDWPGNVRELKNMVERMYTFVEGNQIMLQHVPAGILHASLEPDHMTYRQNSLEEILDTVEKNYLMRLLRENDNNLRKSASILGLHRNTLYRKLEKHGLTRENILCD